MATPTASSALAPSPLKGIFLVLLAVLIFASMDTAGKFLMTKFNVPMAAAVRYGLLAAATLFAGLALQRMPGGALAPVGVGFALLCASVSVIYILLSRSLAATESTMAMLFHVAVTGTILFGVLLLFNWQAFSYAALDVALLAFMGAASLAGHFLLTSAYRFAPASMLAPFNYFHIAFAVILGWLVYNHVPDGWALGGMAMIAAAGTAIAIHTHLSKSKARVA